MLHKSKVINLEYHNQFQKSKQQVKLDIMNKSKLAQKEKKEGQSEFRIKEATKKQSI